MVEIVYHLGPNHQRVMSFLGRVSLLDRDQRVRIADRWQRQVSWSRDEYIEAILHEAITGGRFLHLVNVGNVIAANRSLYALDPAGIVLLEDKLEFINATWIRALEKVTKILVISDLLNEELVAAEIEPFNQVINNR